MIEGINETKSLIEEFLRFGIMGRNRMMKITQPSHQNHRMVLRVGSVILRHGTQAKHSSAQHVRQKNSHLVIPPDVEW
jgi:hypothetical protein